MKTTYSKTIMASYAKPVHLVHDALVSFAERREINMRESSNRNYGIDALRLLLMFMVCILHTMGQGGVLGALTPEMGGGTN